MKHFRRAKHAGKFWIWGSKHRENLAKMKPFGSLGEAWAGHAQPGLAARLSPQPGRPPPPKPSYPPVLRSSAVHKGGVKLGT